MLRKIREHFNILAQDNIEDAPNGNDHEPMDNLDERERLVFSLGYAGGIGDALLHINKLIKEENDNG